MKNYGNALSVLLLLSSGFAFAGKDSKHAAWSHHENDIQRTFDVRLSFEQELVGAPTGPFVPRPANEAPHGTHGKLQLCFSKDLSSVKFKLFVFDASGKRNPNEKITAAHLHAGRADVNGGVIVLLYANADPSCGKAVDGLLAEGTITNEHIIKGVTSLSGYTFNSVASLYDGIRRGEVYANVHGSDTCQPGAIGYANGIIRGQIFTSDVE